MGDFCGIALIEKVKEIGITEFKLVADPYAEDFYKKMGAIPVGVFHSTIFKNRTLSILKVNI